LQELAIYENFSLQANSTAILWWRDLLRPDYNGS
jgi:hypothetical protein